MHLRYPIAKLLHNAAEMLPNRDIQQRGFGRPFDKGFRQQGVILASKSRARSLCEDSGERNMSTHSAQASAPKEGSVLSGHGMLGGDALGSGFTAQE